MTHTVLTLTCTNADWIMCLELSTSSAGCVQEQIILILDLLSSQPHRAVVSQSAETSDET